jgi:6-pyruvoyltetrahydropterin/6-carboxytetrahydropterin synthase
VSRLAIVEIHKEELKFSAGHFMLLSATQRETLHGHDYQISASFSTYITQNGMSFDCRSYKRKLLTLCETLDYRLILPSESEFLRLEATDQGWTAHHANEALCFYRKDVIVLPITNVTLEELSNWFLQQLLYDTEDLKQDNIFSITIKAFNGRGDSAASIWNK